MSFGNPSAGYSLAGEFQSSALPWVTSSIAPSGSTNALKFDFQSCTRFFTVTNLNPVGATGVLAIGFTAAGMSDANSNKYFLSGSQTLSAEIRVKTLYVMGQNAAVPFGLLAGLTAVPAANTPVITGSQVDVSTGNTVYWPGVW